MTSRFSLLSFSFRRSLSWGVAGMLLAACSAPAEGGGNDDDDDDDNTMALPPTAPPPGLGGNNMQQPPPDGQLGTEQMTPTGTNPPAGNDNMMLGEDMTGMMPAPSQIPIGEGLALTPVNGWVAGNTNGVGIQGAFYPMSDVADGGQTQITPADNFSMSAGASICVSGVASQVPNGTSYNTHWGGGIGFNLAEPGNMVPAQPWSRGNVTGFQYTLSGANIPASLRFQVAVAGTDATYCAPAGAAGAPVTMTISGPGSPITEECWNAGNPGIPADAQLVAIQWQVATVLEASTPFDFCVENLTAIVGP